MFVFIDAYNVLKTVKGVDYVAPRVSEDFIQRVQGRAAFRGYHAVLVFDAGEGHRPTRDERPFMTVVYSGLQQNADDVLIQIIEECSEQEKLLVTADRSLRKRGIGYGAQPVDPITYWRALYEEKDNEQPQESSVPRAVVDLTKEYSIEDLKSIAFGMIQSAKNEQNQERTTRKSLARKAPKALKKFEKIKGRL